MADEEKTQWSGSLPLQPLSRPYRNRLIGFYMMRILIVNDFGSFSIEHWIVIQRLGKCRCCKNHYLLFPKKPVDLTQKKKCTSNFDEQNSTMKVLGPCSHQVPIRSYYSFDTTRKDGKLTRLWNHPVLKEFVTLPLNDLFSSLSNTSILI